MAPAEQLEVLKKKLKDIRPDVLAQDRTEAMEKFSIKSRATICNYLTGRVNSLATAYALYEFFHERKEKRKKLLEA